MTPEAAEMCGEHNSKLTLGGSVTGGLTRLPSWFSVGGMNDRWTIIGTGVAIAALVSILHSCQRADMHREFDRVQIQLDGINANVSDLRERVTRIETRLEYALPRPADPFPDQSATE